MVSLEVTSGFQMPGGGEIRNTKIDVGDFRRYRHVNFTRPI